ncbi:MAG: hypothetical protein J0I20_24320 [Chloroflexi bacterium]|nr:hypothetical protein [Chloroflexota bacterium]OJW03462.1 MAG: hypothetical protein BGO39_10685 [Chloroflexi bacterium 54-19]
MTKQQRYAGPRCASCGRPFEPRQMANGKLSETCGQTACVSSYSRKKSSMAARRSMTPRPQTAW